MVTPTSKPDPRHASRSAAAEEIGEAIEAAEQFVDRAVVSAERSLARRIGAHGLRAVLFALRAAVTLAVLAFFAFAVCILALRYYVLPHIGDWRERIAATASAALRVPVGIGAIEAEWQGLRPRLVMRGVTIRDAGGRVALALDEVDAVLAWTSAIAMRPHMHSLSIAAPRIEVRRRADHRFDIAGFIIDPQAAQTDTDVLDWLLAQERISVLGAQVHFVDELAPPAPGNAADAAPPAAQFDFSNVNFLLTQELTGHRFALQLRPPEDLAGAIDLRGRFSRAWGAPASRMASWSGRLFAQVDHADLARLESIVHVIPAPARLSSAHGAMRAWLDFSALQITRLRADVALTGVDAQWRPDLDPMRLANVQGRITRTVEAGPDRQTEELALTGLSMEGADGLRLPATDLLLRATRPSALPAPARAGAGKAEGEKWLFEANHLVLSDWSRLARQFPLPADWLNLIERTAAQGTLDDLHAAWDGPQTPPRSYALRARFAGLGFALQVPAGAAPPQGDAQAPAPNVFQNFAGAIDLTQDGGSLRLESAAARMHLPAIFGDNVLAFDTLAAQLRWSRDAQMRLTVDVETLQAANDDLDVSASGGFREAGAAEAARLELSGRIVRARVAAAPRYLPVFLPGPTLDWLRGALLDGSAADGTFLVRGDPQRFPFVEPRSGEFHVGFQVHDGRLDVAPPPPGATEAQRAQRWPELTGLEANVEFDRDHLTVSARHARAYGYDLNNVVAQIPHIGMSDQHLSVDGQGQGPLPDLLRYAATSPVNRMTGGWLGDVRGGGPAHLALKLDLPLNHPNDTIVAGSIGFQGDYLLVRPDIAPLTGVSGQLDFTQRGVRFAGIGAGFLGGEARLAGDTRPDGSIVIECSGTATAPATRAMLQAEVLRHMLENSRGQVRYSAQLDIVHDTVGLQVDTDLVGLAVNLPPPFRKAEAEARTLHVEITPIAGTRPARDTLRATLQGALETELQRVAAENGSMQIERGFIGIGAHPNPPDSGLLLFVDQPSVDADQWQALLAPAGDGAGAHEGAGGGDGGGVDAVTLAVLHADSLTVAGKTLSNVSLSAQRDAGRAWVIDVDSEQASGSVRWSEAPPAIHGRLTARLARLTIPERDKKQVTELLAKSPTEYPELDITADRFDLGKRSLGRLELQAQNSGEGADGVWTLAKLLISSPDGKVTGSGTWRRDGQGPERRMNLKVTVTGSNVGGMLDRFGWAGYVKDGKGKLDGELSWTGAPFAVDYPSLAGHLTLSAEKGQILKLDAGAARLLAIFSFESFMNLVTGDLREISAGVGFDTVNATATIERGVLTTDDFLMKGSTGAGRIKGSLDLNAETQNLQIVVVPEVNASALSLGWAAFINPAVGLSTLLGTLVLNKPLSSLFTRTYTVTGPWSNPHIDKVVRDQAAQAATFPGGGASASTGGAHTPQQ